jgi:hypothetical protein
VTNGYDGTLKELKARNLEAKDAPYPANWQNSLTLIKDGTIA